MKTLLEFYGIEFEWYHPEGCTCPKPSLPIIDYHNLRYGKVYVTDRCSWCGLKIKPVLMSDLADAICGE